MGYVYVLKLEGKDLLKIGIAGSLSRVLQHCKSYGIDLENSYRLSPPVHLKASKLESVLLDHTMESKPMEDVLSSLKSTDGASEIRNSNSLDSILHLAEALKCEITEGYDIKKSEQGITDQIPDGVLSGLPGNAKIDSSLLRQCKKWSINNDTTLYKAMNLALYQFLESQKVDSIK